MSSTHRISPLMTGFRRRDLAEFVYPYLIGRELVARDGKPDRYIIDFGQADLLLARGAEAAFKWVERRVLPQIGGRAREEEEGHTEDTARRDHLSRGRQHWRGR